MVASGVGWADGMLREYSEDQTVEVVKLLSSLGADVNAANDHGITALHGAGYKGANKAVQLLVDHGAKLDALDKGEDYGFGVSSVRMTPLNWAEGVPIGMSSAIYHNGHRGPDGPPDEGTRHPSSTTPSTAEKATTTTSEPPNPPVNASTI